MSLGWVIFMWSVFCFGVGWVHGYVIGISRGYEAGKKKTSS